MYNYPLIFEIDPGGLSDGVQVRDADKQIVMHGGKMPEEVLEGKQPYRVVNTREQRLPVCQIQFQEADDKPHYAVTAPGGARLGTMVDSGRGRWSILDANGVAIGHIREKNRWRHSFLFDLISSSTMDSVATLIFRIRYDVELNGLRVRQLREMDSEFRKHQAYQLKKSADLSDADELLLLAGLLVVFWSV